MQKLTQEQAGALIEAIGDSCSKFRNPEKTFDFLDLIRFEEIKQVIAIYTENHFPEVIVNDTGERLNDHHIYLDEDKIRIDVEYNLDLTFDEFKEFTERCQAIVKWIEEQKC